MEIAEIHIIVAIEVRHIAVQEHAAARSGHAGSKHGEIGKIRVSVMIEIPRGTCIAIGDADAGDGSQAVIRVRHTVATTNQVPAGRAAVRPGSTRARSITRFRWELTIVV